MKANIEYQNRQIIPRFTNSCISHSMIYNANNKPFSLESEYLYSFDKLKENWMKSNNIITAKELVSSSILFDKGKDSEVKNALNYLNKNDKYPNDIMQTIKSLINDEEGCEGSIKIQSILTKEIYDLISELKHQIWVNPRNALVWSDLAYYYTIIGQLKKAEKCIVCALNINNFNRYIVRSAARFYTHINNYDKADYILNSTPSLTSDPWLLSAEIAINEVFDRKSKNINKAKKILESGNYSIFDCSELFGTISTLEFSNGNKKKGKKLLLKSLEMPNENILAQALYLNGNNDESFNPDNYQLPLKYEVNSWNNYRKSDFKSALKEAYSWYLFQPFSSRPPLLYSYLSSVVFRNHNKAIDILDKALISSPNDPLLLNNKAFSYLNLNNIDKAEKIIMKLKNAEKDEDDLPTYLATFGLYEMKNNNVDLGFELYNKACKAFKMNNNYIGYSRCLYFYSQAIKNIDREKSDKLKKESLEVANKFRVNEIVHLINKEQEHITNIWS